MSAAAWLAQRGAELTGHQGEARLAAEGPHCQAIEVFLGGGGWGRGPPACPTHSHGAPAHREHPSLAGCSSLYVCSVPNKPQAAPG